MCSPEIMQAIASVLAGDPRFCRPEFSLKVASRTVWVDNIRLTGSREEMKAAAAWLDRTAAAVNATWKEEDSLTSATDYDFLGGRWRHEDCSVAVSQKNLDKLPAEVPDFLSFGETERRVGRLVHASGLTNTPLLRYYWS